MNKYRPAISYRFQGVCIRPAGYVRSYSLSLTTRNNLIIGQSGGATAIINASLVGAVEAALEDERIDGLYGMCYGVEGLLKEDVIDLRRQPTGVWQRLLYTPSAALGTCRYRLKDEDPKRLIAILRKYDIHYMLYIGGNDSADTAHRLAEAARHLSHDLHVLNVPKTIDNDLPFTDHSPGYGSAARRLPAFEARDADGVTPYKLR